ncbi:MAG: GntR family transcriptional regulator [Exiguobacterium oxidotolerans]|uniref:GntR family transcriptional regulator n=1 Tax=unclassified Exiguobacterium TaxID=2644629 RepID=UPI000B58BC46|nr:MULTISPECIES: GntR family transcriptional regulator [unclassified Exiguobacterium]ASI35384.1 hypothetical protein A0126_07360 [Exiguobacterium sp. N4-1P]ASI37397.1 hypothetical protein A0126_17640 [Exiguobacterium sp. N4-1P]
MKTVKPIETIIIEKIKRAILNREFAPGMQLTESVIAEKLETSRTPVRNAFKKLELDGYIVLKPNRGAYVIQPTVNDIIQAFELRIELEGVAVKFGLANVEQKDLDYLKQLIEKELDAYTHEDLTEYTSINKKFHMLLAEKSQNRYVIEFLSRIIDQIDVYLMMYNVIDYKSKRNNKSLKEHLEIITAIESRQVDLVTDALQRHLHQTLDSIKSITEPYQSLEDMF